MRLNVFAQTAGFSDLVKAQHYCMKWPWCEEPKTSMVEFRRFVEDFRHDPSLKQEFFEFGAPTGIDAVHLISKLTPKNEFKPFLTRAILKESVS